MADFVVKPDARTPRSAPKSPRPSAPTSDRATVHQAVGVMKNIYAAAGVALVFGNLTKSAEVLADDLDNLENANRAAFEASPKLAQMIANAGNVSAVASFFTAHIMTGFAVAGSVRNELAARRASQPDSDTVPESQFVPA